MVLIDILTLIIIIGVISQIVGASKKKQPPKRQSGQQPPQPRQRVKELLTEAQKKERQTEATKRARAAQSHRTKEQGKYPQSPRLSQQASQQRPATRQAAINVVEGKSAMLPRQEAAGLSAQAADVTPLVVISESEGRVLELGFETEDIVRGLVMAEVLGKPKALKRQSRY